MFSQQLASLVIHTVGGSSGGCGGEGWGVGGEEGRSQHYMTEETVGFQLHIVSENVGTSLGTKLGT